VTDAAGSVRYAELVSQSARIAAGLLAGRAGLREQRVAFLVPPGRTWVATCWGIWRAGGVAVPLAQSHPVPELRGLIADARPHSVIASPELHDRAVAAATKIAVVSPQELIAHGHGSTLPLPGPGRRALMVYTSGTTGRPKGVVTTHANISAQIETLVQAWEWSADDRILHVLPLHHVHGIVNALWCALWSGAHCEFLTPFDAVAVWERFATGEVTVFMAVPTIYRRLIAAWGEADTAQQRRWSAGVAGLRLMVSGSAALPVRTLERWESISSQRLLERYGMTEIGMGLGNPYRGERRPGTVGHPFPGVEARILDEDGEAWPTGHSGQIEVRGPQVFLEYWERPEETESAFHDGWFRTGDEGMVGDDGYWRIVGRRSVDIIKTGGYKVSALEIEEVLRGCEGITDAAVVGVPDEDWGERGCALVTGAGAALPDADVLRSRCKSQLAPYKVPKQIRAVAALPRNAMGKVVKPAVQRMFREAGDTDPASAATREPGA